MYLVILLIIIGLIIGTLGTMMGVGGGFILVPVLLLLFPSQNPAVITAISLSVVFFNALSGSIAYSRMERIDYKSGLIFSAATIPGAILGAYTTSYLPRQTFNLIFGIIMLTTSIFMFFKPGIKSKNQSSPKHFKRKIIEKAGTIHIFSYNFYLGLTLSIIVGFLSSLLGIGGGVIHVPFLVYLLNFPIPIATATSQFVLMITSMTGAGVHISQGTFFKGLELIIPLSIGAVIGSQFGARLSRKLQSQWIVKILAGAIALIGVRLLIS